MINILILSIAIAGITYLYLTITQVGQIFDFMQSVLAYLQPRSEFLYKRLGGCGLCTLQMAIDIEYLLYFATSEAHERWYVWLGNYLLMSGLSHYFYVLLLKQNESTQQPKIEHENINL